MCNIQTAIENWTHIYMNLFSRNGPYYHILKYLLFLLKHPVERYTVLSLCYFRSIKYFAVTSMRILHGGGNIVWYLTLESISTQPLGTVRPVY